MTNPYANEKVRLEKAINSLNVDARYKYFDEDVDLNMIKSTLEKKITKISEEMKKIDVRLSNKSFVDRAPQNIVEQEKSNFANLEKDVKKIELTLKGL